MHIVNGLGELASLHGAVMVAGGQMVAVHPSVHRGATVAVIRLPSEIRSYLVALEWLTDHNARIIEAVPSLPRIYAGVARYLAEPTGWEEFAAAPIVLARKHGDCGHLAPWLAGECRAHGEPAQVALVWRETPTSVFQKHPRRGGVFEKHWPLADRPGRQIHAIVARAYPHRAELEDPSERLGMTA